MIVSPKQAYEYMYQNETLVFPKDWYITANFKWNEVFANEKASDGLPIYEVFLNAYKLADILQTIRIKVGKAINVHCWVRQIKHNKRANSVAKYSGHINGLACDFDISGMTCSQARSLILAMKLPIRIEANTSTWVHIDINNYIKPFTTGLFYV